MSSWVGKTVTRDCKGCRFGRPVKKGSCAKTPISFKVLKVEGSVHRRHVSWEQGINDFCPIEQLHIQTNPIKKEKKEMKKKLKDELCDDCRFKLEREEKTIAFRRKHRLNKLKGAAGLTGVIVLIVAVVGSLMCLVVNSCRYPVIVQKSVVEGKLLTLTADLVWDYPLWWNSVKKDQVFIRRSTGMWYSGDTFDPVDTRNRMKDVLCKWYDAHELQKELTKDKKWRQVKNKLTSC